MTRDCLFCRIVAGEIPADVVHRDDLVVAFRDVAPQAPVHILLVPRDHLDSIADLSLTAEHDRLWSHLLHVVQDLAARDGIAESGYRLLTNVGLAGGQTVAHLHLHLLGGRQMTWPPG